MPSLPNHRVSIAYIPLVDYLGLLHYPQALPSNANILRPLITALSLVSSEYLSAVGHPPLLYPQSVLVVLPADRLQLGQVLLRRGRGRGTEQEQERGRMQDVSWEGDQLKHVPPMKTIPQSCGTHLFCIVLSSVHTHQHRAAPPT